LEFIDPFVKILIINLILSGDNAVVIAMASRNLPSNLKSKAIIGGTVGAVLFRIVFTVIVMYLLKLPYIHLIGGILLLLVAYKLLVEKEMEENKIKTGNSLKEAIVIIIFADMLMSLDNVLGIVAVAGDNMLLIISGIILSIPIMLFASQFILKIMEKYPFVIYIGSALLAWTAGEMMVKEKFIQSFTSNTSIEPVLLFGLIVGTLTIGGVQRKYR
jgi:YjbE family integral membrane protein